jgi:hypothetical protein
MGAPVIDLKTFRERISLNGRLRLLALLLAIITLIAVRQVTSEVSEFDIPVVVELEEGVAILGQDVETVTLTCRGAHDDLMALASRELRAVVRVNPDHVPGTELVAVKRRNIEGRMSGVALLRVEPSAFFVSFDREMSQEVVVVRPRLMGYPAVGRAEVEFEPTSVQVRGPASLVEPLRLLVPESISVAGRADSFTTTRAIQLDETARGVVIEPSEITARVRIVTDQVSLSWTNVPIRILTEPGSAEVVSVEPSTAQVTLHGSEAVLAGLVASDFRLMADCDGLMTGGVHEVSVVLNLPQGLTAGSSVEPSRVRVAFKEAE